MSLIRFILIALLQLIAILAASTSVRAATVVIWPVDPVLKPGEQTTGLWLENKGDTPVTLQVRSFDWSQASGEDRLIQQDDVVASPPIATVEPGKRQLVRVFRRAVAQPGSPAEKSYRLIVDELPQVPSIDAQGGTSAGLAVQMRYSIPLFAYAADTSGKAPLLVPTYRASGTARTVEIRNAGIVHARLTDLRLVSGGKEHVIKAGLVGYVLPGATLRLPLPDNSPGIVTVGVNGKDVTLTPAI